MQSAVFHIQTDPLKLWYVAHGRVQSPCPPQLFIILERETGTGACTGPSKTGRGVSRILSRGRVGTALCHGGLAPFTAPCSGQADGQTERHDISGWQARTVSGSPLFFGIDGPFVGGNYCLNLKFAGFAGVCCLGPSLLVFCAAMNALVPSPHYGKKGMQTTRLERAIGCRRACNRGGNRGAIGGQSCAIGHF